MKKIMMTKYGFVRRPEEDFSDDGNRFTCFRAGKNVRVSKLVADGQAYLSADSSVGNRTLPYDVYSKLPHYHDAGWKWNGVSVASLTEQDLIDFYNACVAYEQEYEAAEASMVYPTLEELTAKAHKIVSHRLFEISKIENRLKKYTREAIEKFSSYEWKRVQDCTKSLMADVKKFDPDTYPQQILGTASSFNFIKSENDMDESYWFKSLKEIFEKYGMKV
jgi:hypothetical protein